MMLRSICIFVVLSSLCFAREWKFEDGTKPFSAELADFQNGIAYLQEESCSMAEIPISRLSAEDQDLLKTTDPPKQTFKGKVESVRDGDTLIVRENNTNY